MAVENQHLKHGKALCGKVFARFVETFNALVDFMCNVQGDADAKNGEGHITFDRSNPNHPIIRCNGCGKQGEEETGPSDDRSCFNIISKNGSTVTFGNSYVMKGGVLYVVSDSVLDMTGCTIAALYCNSRGDFELVSYAGLEDLINDQMDMSCYVIPLYVFDANMNVVTDLRNALNMQVWE